MMDEYTAKFNNRTFRTRTDLPEVGVYLLVFEEEKCTYDYLQDSIQACIEFAKDEFGVPPEIWTRVEKEGDT